MPRSRFPVLLFGLCAAIAVAVIVWVVADYKDLAPKLLTRDPYQAGKMPFYYGYASLFGSAVWICGGAATLAIAFAARTIRDLSWNRPGLFRLALWGGAIGLVMGIDDLLLIHDAWARRIGIPEILFHAVYAGATVALAATTWRTMLRETAWPLYVITLAGYASSSIIDFIRGEPEVLRQAEDIFKLAAIITWTVYFADVARLLIREQRTS